MKTKRRISISLVVIFLTICMFIGSTFAWFTSETIVKNNIIKGGELGVGLSHLGATMSEDQKTIIADADEEIESSENIDSTVFYDIKPYEEKDKGIFDSDTLWEPGASHCEVVQVTANKDFSVKFKMYFGPEGTFEEEVYEFAKEENAAYAKNDNATLNKVGLGGLPFEVYTKSFVDAPDTNAEASEDVWPGYDSLFENINNPEDLINAGWTFTDLSVNPVASVAQGEAKKGAYEAGDNYHSIVAMVVKLKESVGNEWQGEGRNFDIKLIATQLNADEDAYTKDYDKDAGFIEAKYYTDYADYALVSKILPFSSSKINEGRASKMDIPKIVSLDRGQSYDWLMIDEEEGTLVKKTPAFVIEKSDVYPYGEDINSAINAKLEEYASKELINEKFTPLLATNGGSINVIDSQLYDDYMNVLYLLSPGEEGSKGFFYANSEGGYIIQSYKSNSPENGYSTDSSIGYHPVIHVNKDIVEFVKREEIAILVEKGNITDKYSREQARSMVDFSYTSDNFDVYFIDESQQLLVSFKDRFEGGNVVLPTMYCESEEIVPLMAEIDINSIGAGGISQSIKRLFFGGETVEDIKDDMTIIMSTTTKPQIEVYTDQYGNKIFENFASVHLTEASNNETKTISPRFVATDNSCMTITNYVAASQNTVDATLERFKSTLSNNFMPIANSKNASIRSMLMLTISDVDIISEETVKHLRSNNEKEGLKTLAQGSDYFYVRCGDELKLMKYEDGFTKEIDDYKNYDVHFEFKFKENIIDFVTVDETYKVNIIADQSFDSPIVIGTKLSNYGKQSAVFGEKDDKLIATFDVVPGGEVHIIPENMRKLNTGITWCFAEEIRKDNYLATGSLMSYSKENILNNIDLYVYPRITLQLYSYEENIFGGDGKYISSNIVDESTGESITGNYGEQGGVYHYFIDFLDIKDTTITLKSHEGRHWELNEMKLESNTITLNGDGSNVSCNNKLDAN